MENIVTLTKSASVNSTSSVRRPAPQSGVVQITSIRLIEKGGQSARKKALVPPSRARAAKLLSAVGGNDRSFFARRGPGQIDLERPRTPKTENENTFRRRLLCAHRTAQLILCQALDRWIRQSFIVRDANAAGDI